MQLDLIRVPGRSHVDSLYLAHDGRIDPAALRLARALDAAEATERPPPAPGAIETALAPRPRPRGIVLAHMAQALIDGVSRDGACTADDLRRLGFTKTEIEGLLPEARTIAIAAGERHVERFVPPPVTPRRAKRGRADRGHA